MKILYSEHIRKDIEEKYACKSECWMSSEYNERVEDNWKISHGNYIFEIVDNLGLEHEVEKLNTMLLHVGAFVLSISRPIMNGFLHANNGFYKNNSYYNDTDSLCI